MLHFSWRQYLDSFAVGHVEVDGKMLEALHQGSSLALDRNNAVLQRQDFDWFENKLQDSIALNP